MWSQEWNTSTMFTDARSQRAAICQPLDLTERGTGSHPPGPALDPALSCRIDEHVGAALRRGAVVVTCRRYSHRRSTSATGAARGLPDGQVQAAASQLESALVNGRRAQRPRLAKHVGCGKRQAARGTETRRSLAPDGSVAAVCWVRKPSAPAAVRVNSRHRQKRLPCIQGHIP